MRGVHFVCCPGCGAEKLFQGESMRCATCGTEVKAPARSKYRAEPAEAGGVRFASRREAKRYGELLLLQSEGHVEGLRRQVPFELHCAGGKLVCRYVADFVYTEAGAQVVEDCKGYRTREYLLKRKWMRLEHGITIRET